MRLSALALTVAALTGCATRGGEPAAVHTRGSTDTASPPAGMRSAAEQACLRDVSLEANTRDLIPLQATPSPEGTEVIVGVGPQRARWRCIGYDDGTTTVVISLAEERLL
jgi:hypothetical protein